MPRLKLAGNTQKKKKCVKGFPCGYSCQPQGRTCRKILKGQGKTYQDYLKVQADRLGKVTGYLENRKDRVVPPVVASDRAKTASKRISINGEYLSPDKVAKTSKKFQSFYENLRKTKVGQGGEYPQIAYQTIRS